jgi:signal transduction histidine kinase
LFSRYLLSIGTPLEIWLQRLSEAAQQEQDPETFLVRANEYLAEMPWMSGLMWVSDRGHGSLGTASQHSIEVVDQDLTLTLFSHRSVSPTVLLHVRLLVRILGHFYQAKRREQNLREITRLQTIYETGARLTHDLKNMLQSLFALTSIAQHDAVKAQPILKHQLPVMTERIETLLTKLKAPEANEDKREIAAGDWWEMLRQRHQHRDIEWEYVTGDVQQLVPAAMLDCVADNLIENACNKFSRERGINIRVKLCLAPFSLSVCDTGSQIPSGIARNLTRTVIPSEDGLGIGLFQAARWAQQSGYHLILVGNEKGKVSFELKKLDEITNI